MSSDFLQLYPFLNWGLLLNERIGGFQRKPILSFNSPLQYGKIIFHIKKSCLNVYNFNYMYAHG